MNSGATARDRHISSGISFQPVVVLFGFGFDLMCLLGCTNLPAQPSLTCPNLICLAVQSVSQSQSFPPLYHIASRAVSSTTPTRPDQSSFQGQDCLLGNSSESPLQPVFIADPRPLFTFRGTASSYPPSHTPKPPSTSPPTSAGPCRRCGPGLAWPFIHCNRDGCSYHQLILAVPPAACRPCLSNRNHLSSIHHSLNTEQMLRFSLSY